MIAIEVEKIYAEEAKKRQSEAGGDRKSEDYKKSLPVNLPEAKNGKSEAQDSQNKETEKTQKNRKKVSDSPRSKTRDNESAVKAGKAVGVGEKSVRQAKKLQSEHPDLAEKVKSGEVSLKPCLKSHLRRSDCQHKRKSDYSSGAYPAGCQSIGSP